MDSLLDSYEFVMNEKVSVREEMIKREMQLDKIFSSLTRTISLASQYAGVVLTPRPDFTVLINDRGGMHIKLAHNTPFSSGELASSAAGESRPRTRRDAHSPAAPPHDPLTVHNFVLTTERTRSHTSDFQGTLANDRFAQRPILATRR